jgi:hypothetical protein
MKDKCEIREKLFSPCKGMTTVLESDIAAKGSFILSDYKKCPCCGVSLKPEPEVIIRKSGETWVGKLNEKDYLWTGEILEDEFQPRAILKSRLLKGDGNWELISEIEITDEIAKLRPMVVYTHIGINIYNRKSMCIAVIEGTVRTLKGQDSVGKYRLATVSDLEEN